MAKFYSCGTRPFKRVTVRKDRICAVCGKLIKKGEQADYISWWSYSGARQEWHCSEHFEESH